MWENKKAWKVHSQHDKLNITLFNQYESCFQTKRKVPVQGHWLKHDFYFILITKGHASYFIDDKQEKVKEGELLFVVPHQIYTELKPSKGVGFFRLTIDDELLSLMPRAFTFLLNCFDSPVVSFDFLTLQRVKNVVEILHAMLKQDEQNTVTLPYVHVLLSEIENAYVKRKVIALNSKFNLEKFYAFKRIVERDYRQQPGATAIAKEIGMNAEAMNRVVSKFSGMNAKEYILRRLLLEAKRHLFYDDCPVKELAYNLGFSDPNYFSRLFKRKEGMSISDYVKRMRDLSR